MVSFILGFNGPVGEPTIREYLQKKYDSIDQGLINRHLHKIESLGCIGLVSPGKKTRSNFWDVKSRKQLQNISHEFPELLLNTYEKSVDIVIRGLDVHKNSTHYIYTFLRLTLSPAFFNACLNSNIELLHSRALEVFKDDKGLKNEILIDKLLNKCNTLYFKGKLNLEISDTRFREIMEKLALEDEKNAEDRAWEILGCSSEKEKEKKRNEVFFTEESIIALKKAIFHTIYDYSVDPSCCSSRFLISGLELYYKTLQEKAPELPDIEIKTILKTPDEYQNMYKAISEALSLIVTQNMIFENTYLDLLFEHYYHQDILDGVVSEFEKSFALKTKKWLEELKGKSSDEILSELPDPERERLLEIKSNEKLRKDIWGF